MTIRILPPIVINRIAAGEVIERPASAVKEIVENAIDAGANKINVVIEQGGRNLIRVTDNGCGMQKDELELAVERHATSKLTDDNLLHIDHFGFRGEALPSIGSVSRLTITSKARDTDDAWSISIEGGNKSSLSPASLNAGTRVEVRDLFFATPARLKFLKTERTEQQHIVSTINQLAMSYPTIAFSLNSDEKNTINLPAYADNATDSHLNRIADIIGKEFADNALVINAERDNVSLTGYAGVPTFNRGTSSAQYLFVNDRPVKDRLILGAVRGAYQDFLARDRHPVVVLFLDVPSDEVDVNVHPAKAEVRFRDSGNIRGLIVGALKNALASAGHRASTTVSQSALSAFTPANTPSNISSFPSGSIPPAGLYERNSPTYRSANTAYQAPLHVADTPSVPVAEEIEQQEQLEQYPLGAARAQVHETYIVAQTDDGLVIVDQHAAHERLVYEQMKCQIEKEGIKTQALLIPEVVELDENRLTRLINKQDELAQLGLIIEPFSEQAIIVKETPAILGELNIKGLVNDLADDIIEFGESLSLKEKLEHVCGTIACHGSIRSGRRLNTHEMNALLRQMEATPHSGQCNHGRPTYVELKLDQIEKLFGRK